MTHHKYNESIIISITEWINNNLDQRLSVNDIAEKAGYSKWCLQKLFTRYHNETLARYIRRRKLNASVNDLKHSGTPIITLALKYHFESQQSFTRSFRQIMGCTPSACRKRRLRDGAKQQSGNADNLCAQCSYRQHESSEPVSVSSHGTAQTVALHDAG